MLKINVITLLPKLFDEHLNNLPFKRAFEKKVLDVNIVNLRNYALDSYGTVDDKPYGGGIGMVLMIEPIYNALKDLHGNDFEKTKDNTKRIIVLSPKGKKLTQQIARELTQATDITLICGRYEGIDERVTEELATDVISIGDYVVSGGELPAMVLMEAVTRLLPGVLDKEGASEIESFENGTLEYPQYTRPETFKAYTVPPILLSGNHKEIEKWRKDKMQDTNITK